MNKINLLYYLTITFEIFVIKNINYPKNMKTEKGNICFVRFYLFLAVYEKII